MVEDQQQTALPPEQADAEPVDEPQPYAFEPSQTSFAVEAIDQAVSGGADSWAAAAAVATDLELSGCVGFECQSGVSEEAVE